MLKEQWEKNRKRTEKRIIGKDQLGEKYGNSENFLKRMEKEQLHNVPFTNKMNR